MLIFYAENLRRVLCMMFRATRSGCLFLLMEHSFVCAFYSKVSSNLDPKPVSILLTAYTHSHELMYPRCLC